jgi:uncharacterized protein (TIGR00369 family)
MSQPAIDAPRDGSELMERFLPQSPFVAKLGVEVEQLGDGVARLRLPWDPANVTVGEMVHGGALAALVDIVAMAAAWSGAALPEQLRGVTTSLAVQFLAPAQARDVIATGSVLHRGRSLVHLEVDLEDADGTRIAKAVATYKVG